MPLPISVVVPRMLPTDELYMSRCSPSIRENDPIEIIAEEGEGDICARRKSGAAKATQPYLMFVDENMVIYEWALSKMMKTLEQFKDVAFVYCDSRHFTGRKSMLRKSKPWEPAAIKTENFVGLASLMRRETFPMDADLKDPAGQDIWTTLAERGQQGLYISETLFEVHEEEIQEPTKQA